MKKLLNYLPFHFLICIICGILLQFYSGLWKYSFSYLTTLILSALLLLYIFKRNKSHKAYVTVSFLLFVLIGISSAFINNPKNHSNYYEYHTPKNSTTILIINKILKSGNYYHKFIAEIVQINTTKTTGYVLVNLKKDSSSTSLKIDDRIFTTSNFKNIKASLNPYQFNYKNYLTKQYINHQIFIDYQNYKRLKKRECSIYGLSAKIRNKIQASLNNHSFSKNETSVINALLLGERKNISKEVIQSYINAGAIHILAISGLHIGILLIILNYLFKPIESLKHGAIVKTVSIIIILWSFAFIAGLSASVIRAVTMFTFVAIGESLKRKKIIEFSLISSMLFLLLIKPLLLFDVGFQLSYLAVFGIIWVQPLLYNMYKPKYWLTNKFWSLLTVSIAAQVGILPISLYYFHQFPGLFFISNLIIIPFLSVILIGGILVVILSIFNILPQLLVDSYGFAISYMNKIVNWVSKQETFLFQEITMSFYQMIIWYFIIIFSYQLITTKKAKQFILLLLSLLSLQINYILQKHSLHTKQEIILFHKNRKTLLGLRTGKEIHVTHSLDTSTVYLDKAIKAYRINENTESTFSTKTPSIINFNSKKLLIIDSLGIYNINIIKPIIILQHSPKINLVRLIKTLKPKQITADGSNYKSYINRWKSTCNKLKTPFYQTGENGAFIIDKN